MREILSLIVTPDLPWLMMASAVVIGAAHMIGCALARYYDWAHVDPPWSYVWGVGMLLTAYFAHCWANDRIAAFLPLLLIVMAGGAADVLCYHFMPRPPKPPKGKPPMRGYKVGAENLAALMLEIERRAEHGRHIAQGIRHDIDTDYDAPPQELEQAIAEALEEKLAGFKL